MATPEEFWNWFAQHERELFEPDLRRETERERISNLLTRELKKVDPNLVFEVGLGGTPREFVISAGGIKRSFPAVVSLVNAAPHLARWQVTAFRPRCAILHHVIFGGKRVELKDIQFSLLDNEKTAGIYLFIPGFRDGDEDLKQIGYLLLDGTLGEYDVATRLGVIKMLSPETGTGGVRYPLAELAARFDELVSRLEGRSGKPS
jgi:hypothetical protein